tara:strand:- start:292 stop:498 length:207 start_codon:yes stop_codon:yes gene_type:complete
MAKESNDKEFSPILHLARALSIEDLQWALHEAICLVNSLGLDPSETLQIVEILLDRYDKVTEKFRSNT